MAAPQSFGRDVVTPQQAVELGTDEYAALRDGMARRLNCEGAAVYGCNEAGLCADVEAAFPRIRNGACGAGGHRHAPFVRCGAPLEARRQARRAARGGASAPRRLGSGTPRLPCAVCSVAAGPAPPMDHAAKTVHAVCRRRCARAVPSDALRAVTSDDAVVCVGLQGCGKSTFSRTLYALLRQARLSPCWINQEEAGGRRQFLGAIRRAQRGGHTHLIIDKMNLDEAARDDYADLGLRALTVVWSHPDGTDALVDICFDRVRRRGSAHRTFKADRGEGRRVRQTLLDCATRCRPPTEGPLIEVGVTDDTATIARRVWAELSARGLTDIPETQTLDMAAALGVANACESFLCFSPATWSMPQFRLRHPRVLELVPPEMLDGKKVQKAFHVTTLYLGRDACKDPVLLQQLVGLLGESIELTPTSASDPKGTAIAVRNEGEFPCENVHPHITIANAPGVPPAHSNELLDDSHADDPCRTVVSLPAGTRVTGTFVFRWP
ncbi:putative Fungal tRNA ligase phosphodiesterase domain containing protein [Trypanosoma cruzi]|nr:putative Fungal tRNA ligase phosphodiesterase domain containing protein [Trypanosoma cruzi]